jgi:hypothetical protein
MSSIIEIYNVQLKGVESYNSRPHMIISTNLLYWLKITMIQHIVSGFSYLISEWCCYS